MNNQKYTKQYFPVKDHLSKWINKDSLEHAPIYCSVDLRDGNQALKRPMTIETKLEFFKELVRIGFKEIEIGFPASNCMEFDFCRKLIEGNLIPSDVTIQVLTQARPEIIKRTFQAIDGAENAIVHFYNPTSVVQRDKVFGKTKDEIKQIATKGARLVKHYGDKQSGNFRYQYSPESFTGTEPEFALEVCNAVIDVLQPTKDRKTIINLPGTVQHSMPHVFANQVEWFCENIKCRDSVVISLHPHNDRGTSVADCELGLLAGADRIEGTLFGNGERTGNCDLVTVALNLLTHGVDPKLDFSDIKRTIKVYEKSTHMKVHSRSPYAGDLVNTAYSGGHQDAIQKVLEFIKKIGSNIWNVPYLPIDPRDLGLKLKSVIQLNSQCGKGGVKFVLEQNGIEPIEGLCEKVRERIKIFSINNGNRLLKNSEVKQIASELLN